MPGLCRLTRTADASDYDVKLLFDQNLSPQLVACLADLFPRSCHVQTAGLDCADDDRVWEYARLNGYAIVTKDEDYNNRSITHKDMYK